MSNKQIIKKVFDDHFDSNKMRQQILFKYERTGKKKMSKIIKYSIVPIGLVFAAFIGILFQKENDILERNPISTIQVYAYTMSEEENLEKTELKDHVKLGLASYNFAMSSVPGYPIVFELHHVDSLKIDVTNGTISDWNRNTGEVKSLGNIYQLSDNKTLYFNINENTNIKIKGIKDKKEVFEKNITISRDDQFNYYATIK